MSRRSAAKSTAQLQTDNNSDNMESSWDNTATTYGVWTQTVALAVAASNDAFDTLVVKGITSNSRGTVFMNTRHMLLTVNQLDTTVYTWDAPSPVDPEANLSAANLTHRSTLFSSSPSGTAL